MGEPTRQSSNPGPGFGLPPPNTGNRLLDLIARVGLFFIQLERRFDPFVRPALRRGCCATRSRADDVPDQPQARRTTGSRSPRRSSMPDEEACLQSIIDQLHGADARALEARRLRARRQHQDARASCAASSSSTTACPSTCGAASTPSRSTYRAWVRFSGPGPYITPDIDDVGFMSISIKLMGVPGPKLMDEEKFTQDMFGVSTPTFVTPDTKANAQLQIESLKNAQIFYFVNLREPHILDLDHAGALDQDAEQPVRGAVLQLRAVPAGRGPGDAVLGLAEDREADADPAAAAAPARRLPARRDGRRRSPRATSSSTSGSSCRPTRT